MAKQTGKNIYVAFKIETTFNTIHVTLTGAEKLRLNPSPGLNMTRSTIAPGEIRADLMTQMPRLGSRSVGGSYNCDLSISSFDSIFEALFRSTWVAAVDITQATMTSITTTTSTIVAPEGNWITQGIRLGDIVRLTGHSTAANNDKNLTVKSVFEDGMDDIATLAIGTATEKFATTTTATFSIANVDYSKVATDDLPFSGTSTINTAGAGGTTHWGTFLVQINAAGTVSTKHGTYTSGTDQDYASEAAAIVELATPDADNIQLGYITVQGKAATAWTEATDDLTAGGDCETATFYNLPGAVLARTITVVGTPLTVDAAPDATFTLTILKKLKNATTPTRRSFYIEEYNQDIDQSEGYGGCRWSGFTIRGGPDSMATIELRVVGASQTGFATGDSPLYTNPTLATDIGLIMVDAGIYKDGVAVATITNFELNCDLNAQGLAIIGGTTTPDVFDNETAMSGTLSMLREDLTYITALGAETEYTLQLLLVEPDATDPIDCLNFYLPRIKFTGVDTPLGQDGGMIQTTPFAVGMAEAVSADGIDAVMMTICTET